MFALRAELLFLLFPKEKGTKKKENLRAYALKNPLDCTELLRSIKNIMFVFAAITGRAFVTLRRPSGWESCTKREEKVGATIGRPRLRRAFAVKMNSDGQNSFSHYLCYVELTSSAHEPSP